MSSQRQEATNGCYLLIGEPAINLAFLRLLRHTDTVTTTTYLDRFLEPMTEALTLEVARVLGDLRVDPETEAEVQRLRERANEGKLTIEEEAAYKDFVEAADVISII